MGLEIPDIAVLMVARELQSSQWPGGVTTGADGFFRLTGHNVPKPVC